MYALTRPSTILVLLLIMALGIGLLALIGPSLQGILQDWDTNSPYFPKVTKEKLENAIPSKHVLEDHPERKSSAIGIRRMMLNGECRPVEFYACDDLSYIVTCPASQSTQAGLKFGLVLGMNTNVLVSGYPALNWDSKAVKNNCVGPFTLPLP